MKSSKDLTVRACVDSLNLSTLSVEQRGKAMRVKDCTAGLTAQNPHVKRHGFRRTYRIIFPFRKCE